MPSMNAVEQRAHRTVTSDLQRQITDMAAIVEQLGRNDAWLKHEGERTAECVTKLSDGVTHALIEIQDVNKADIKAIREMPRWQRLRWVLGL